MGFSVGIFIVWLTATAGAISNLYWLSALSGLLCLMIAVCALYFTKPSPFLLFIGLAGVSLAWMQKDGNLIIEGLRSAATFVSFLASLYILRGIVQTSPALYTVLSGLDGLPQKSHHGAMQLLGFTFAIPLAVGAAGVAAPLITRIREEASREDNAAWTLRGMGLAVFFSPFTVAMGTVINALGDRLVLPLLLVTGFTIAFFCLALPFILGHCHIPTQLSRHFWQQTLRVFLPILFLIITVVGMIYFSHLSALESIALLVPGIAFIIVIIRGQSAGGIIIKTASNGWKNMGGEVAVFVAALVFATALSSHPEVSYFSTKLADRVGPGVLIGLTVIGIASMTMVGLHMLVTTTIFLTSFEPYMLEQIHLIMLGIAGLIGWGFGSMVAPGSPAFLLSTRIFMVSIKRMAFGINMRFMLTIILIFCFISISL